MVLGWPPECLRQLRRPTPRDARDKNALIWVPESEDDETQEITYAELHRRVNEFAALVRDFAGLKKG